MHRFKDLEIWKRSREFCSKVYHVTSKFPDNEKFGLTNQLRRASVSISSNISEGSSRSSNKDFSRFLEITLGPCYEVETQFLIAYDLKFISDSEIKSLLKELDEITKMISRFKAILK